MVSVSGHKTSGTKCGMGHLVLVRQNCPGIFIGLYIQQVRIVQGYEQLDMSMKHVQDMSMKQVQGYDTHIYLLYGPGTVSYYNWECVNVARVFCLTRGVFVPGALCPIIGRIYIYMYYLLQAKGILYTILSSDETVWIIQFNKLNTLSL